MNKVKGGYVVREESLTGDSEITREPATVVGA